MGAAQIEPLNPALLDNFKICTVFVKFTAKSLTAVMADSVAYVSDGNQLSEYAWLYAG